MMKRFLYVLIPFCALWMPRAYAEEPRTIDWEVLSVKVSAADNPFATLSTEQLVHQLKDWCERAEKSDVPALVTFSRRLRCYA